MPLICNNIKLFSKNICRILLIVSGIFLTTCSFAAPAENVNQHSFPAVENFHKVSNELYRSGQPDKEDWQKLADFGIKSVINLRDFGRNADKVGNTGIVVYSLPWRAENITEEDLLNVLRLIKKAPKPVLIHCYHGSDRTGAAVAAYRVVFQNWSPEAAANELINGGFGHHKVIYRNIPHLIRKTDYKKLRSRL